MSRGSSPDASGAVAFIPVVLVLSINELGPTKGAGRQRAALALAGTLLVLSGITINLDLGGATEIIQPAGLEADFETLVTFVAIVAVPFLDTNDAFYVGLIAGSALGCILILGYRHKAGRLGTVILLSAASIFMFAFPSTSAPRFHYIPTIRLSLLLAGGQYLALNPMIEIITGRSARLGSGRGRPSNVNLAGATIYTVLLLAYVVTGSYILFKRGDVWRQAGELAEYVAISLVAEAGSDPARTVAVFDPPRYIG